jgi:hypothetical protein
VSTAGRERWPAVLAGACGLPLGRRSSWTPVPVTGDGTLGEGTVPVGPESGLLWDGQVAVPR